MPRSYHPPASSRAGWLSRLWVLRPRFRMKASSSLHGHVRGYIGLGVFLSGRHISWLAYMYLHLLSFYVFARTYFPEYNAASPTYSLFLQHADFHYRLYGLARQRTTRPTFFRVENGFFFPIILQCSCARCSSYIYTPSPDREKRRDMKNEEIQALACYPPTPPTIQLPRDPPFVN